MVKPTIVSAALLLVVVLAMAEASSAFRTIIIEDEVGQTNPREMVSKCLEQMMKQQMMSKCQRYLREVMSPGSGEEQYYMDLCCQQLGDMDEDCRCYGLEEAARMQTEKQERRRPGEILGEKIKREAEMMYSQCNLSPPTCALSRSS